MADKGNTEFHCNSFECDMLLAGPRVDSVARGMRGLLFQTGPCTNWNPTGSGVGKKQILTESMNVN